jgi:photosystem II stability/assembly factor-like uncharacterized protein
MKRKLFAPLAVGLASMTALLLWLCLIDGASSGPSKTILAAPLDDPTVTGVEPDSAPNDVDVPIVITGTGFAANARVMLGDVALPNASRVSSVTLTATVPWGREPGVYTVTVANPGGESGILPDAFTVTHGIGVWVSGGPYGGRIWNLVLHPITPTRIYASASGSGLFFSQDAAAHWELRFTNPMPTRLALDAHTPQVMYIGGSNEHVCTRDGGLTWERTVPPGVPTSRHPYSFQPVAHPTLTGTVYLAVSGHGGVSEGGGLYRSDDWATSWVTLTVPTTDTHITAVAFHPDDPDTMFLGTHSGHVYTSSDGGDTWAWAAQVASHVERLAVNPFDPHEVWAVANAPGHFDQPGLFRCTDASLAHWLPVTITDQLPQVYSLVFHPTVSGTLWAAADSGYVSTDGGQTWSPVGPGLPGVMDWAVDPSDPDRVYAGTMRGVFQSTDRGNTWDEANQGLQGIVPNLGLAASPANPDEVYVATDGMVFRSHDGGQVWQEMDVPPTWEVRPHLRLVAVDPFTPIRVYLGSSTSPQVHISEDRGQTWYTVTLPLPPGWTGWGGVWALAPHPRHHGRILAGVGLYPSGGGIEEWPGALYISHDSGASWEHLDIGVPISGVLTLAYDPANAQVVYAGTEGSGLLRSGDGGLTWQPISSWPGTPYILAVTVHPQNHKVFVSDIGPGQAIYVSDDMGQTWARLPEQPTTSPVWELLYTQAQTPTLYAGTMGASLHRSTDDGLTWTRAAGMPGAANVPSLATVAYGERVVLYVGTSGGVVSPPLAGEMAAGSSANSLLLGSGVYRHTTIRPLEERVYLPLVSRGSGMQ